MRFFFTNYLVFQFLIENIELCLPSGSKCTMNNCYMVPPSPPSYAMAPMLSMSPSIMSQPPPPPRPSYMSSYALAPPPSSYPHIPYQSSMTMMASQTPFLDPPLPPPQVSSSALTSVDKNQYEIGGSVGGVGQEIPRWDRQEPEYKHIDEAEAVVAPDVVVADSVDEKSTNSEKVEKVHENERLARMDLKYEEPEPTPFDNGTVTFHAWFVRKL